MVLLLANIILVHAQSSLVHKVCGTLLEIIYNVVHIHLRPGIRTILLNQSPALNILGTLAACIHLVRVGLSSMAFSLAGGYLRW
jgi:hypothetical protein